MWSSTDRLNWTLDRDWDILFWTSGPDFDGDMLEDGTEYLLGTDPKLHDTDGDGFSDGAEVAAGTNPNDGQDTPTSASVPAMPGGLWLLLSGILTAAGFVRIRRRATC